MKTIPLLLAAAACQSAAIPADPAARCSITVSFGSYAMGIDTAAAAAVDKLLAENKAVNHVSRTGAGREGEYGLCISTRDAAASTRLFERIAALLPARPRGPISVEAGDRRLDRPAR